MKHRLSECVNLYKRVKVKAYVIKNSIVERLYRRFYTDPLVIMDMEQEAITQKEKEQWAENRLAEMDSTYVPEHIDEEDDIAKYSV